jgi:hypothetical protein
MSADKKRRMLLLMMLVTVALSTVACFSKETPVGPPERTGAFSIQKHHLVRFYDTGNGESDFYEITHQRTVFSTKIRFPEIGWTSFDRVIRLPCKQPAWLVGIGGSTALLTEQEHQPRMELLWRPDVDEAMQPITNELWHIPDYVRVARFPDEIYRGGRVFDGVSLDQRWLPDQPAGRRSRFVAISPDGRAAAWLRTTFDSQFDHETKRHFILVSDEQGTTAAPLELSESFLKRFPTPGLYPPRMSWQPWFDSALVWGKNAAQRWEVRLKG